MPERKPDSALIDRLVEDGAAVRRPWAPAARLAAWLALLAAVATAIALRSGWPLGGPPRYVALAWEVSAAAGVAALWGALALGAAIPGREPNRAALALAAALTPLPALLWLWGPPARLDAPLAAFVASGVPCAVMTAAFALLLWVPLFSAQYRAAPLDARLAAGLTAAAGFAAGYVLMRFFCAADDPAHLGVWHALPALLGAAVAAAAATRLLARWRRGPAAA